MLTYSNTTNVVTLFETILNGALSTINTYSTAQVIVTNLNTNISTTTNLLTTQDTYYIPNQLTNRVFGLTGGSKPASGIYRFKFTLVKNGLTSVETQCLLVDDNVLCSLKEDKEKFLMYLTLKETYQCTCECDKLFTIFKSIVNQDGETNCNC